MPSCVYSKCTNYESKVNKRQGIGYHLKSRLRLSARSYTQVLQLSPISVVRDTCLRYYVAAIEADIFLYNFPTDEVRLQDWIAIVRQQRNQTDWKPSKSSRICSDHFRASDKYVTEKGRTRIKKDALPFIEKSTCPSSLDNVNTPARAKSETPLNRALKKRVRDLLIDKKELRRRNKILNQRNKRLKIKIARMKLIFKEIKSKVIILVE